MHRAAPGMKTSACIPSATVKTATMPSATAKPSATAVPSATSVPSATTRKRQTRTQRNDYDRDKRRSSEK